MASTVTRKIAATCAILGLATIGVAAAPKPANAWWHHGWGGGWGCCGVGVFVPPIVVAPPAPAYYPPPAAYYAPPAQAYYAPPARAWVPAHWQGSYWVPGHWS